MVLIETKWNFCQGRTQNMWLANDKSEITADFDQDSSPGSAIFVISDNATYMKNADGKWQKCGTSEVIE